MMLLIWIQFELPPEVFFGWFVHSFVRALGGNGSCLVLGGGERRGSRCTCSLGGAGSGATKGGKRSAGEGGGER